MTEPELAEYKAQSERMALEFQMEQLKFQREITEQKQLFDKFQQLASARQLAFEIKNHEWSKAIDEQLKDITNKIYPLSKITL